MAVKKIAYRINVAKSNFHHISGAYVGKESTSKGWRWKERGKSTSGLE